MRKARPSTWSIRSSRFSMFPTDLDIFSPPSSTTNAWCIQWLAKRSAERHRLGPLVLVVGELEVEARRSGGRTPRPAGRAT